MNDKETLHTALKQSFNWYPAPYYVLQPDAYEKEQPRKEEVVVIPIKPNVVFSFDTFKMCLPLIFIAIILIVSGLLTKF